MLNLIIGRSPPWLIPSHYFMLLLPPLMLSDSPRVNWNENRVLVDSWKIMAFPTRVGFGNCSVVRLTCVVPVLFAASHEFPRACPEAPALTLIQIHVGWCTHPVFTYRCSQTPPLLRTDSQLILKRPGLGREGGKAIHFHPFIVFAVNLFSTVGTLYSHLFPPSLPTGLLSLRPPSREDSSCVDKA